MKTHKHSFLMLSALLATGLTLPSCGGSNSEGKGILDNLTEVFSSEVDAEAIQKALSTSYPQLIADSTRTDTTVSDLTTQVITAYRNNENRPLWLDGNKFTQQAKDFVQSLASLQWDGLDPEQYQLSTLQQALNASKAPIDSLALWDIAFTRTFLNAAHDLTYGVLNPEQIDKEWHADNDSTHTALEQLTAGTSGKERDLQAFRPANPRYALMQQELQKWTQLQTDTTYQQLKTAYSADPENVSLARDIMQKELNISGNDTNLIRTYQYLNHLSANGKLDKETQKVLHKEPVAYIQQLKINMERLRWLPNNMEDRYIWVSIPQTEIDYFKDGNNLFHNRSVVGAKSNRTPTILKPLRNIVICPPWTLPLSIVKKDYGGKIPSSFEVYHKGKRVPNSMVNASNYRQFTVRQPAGPRAALGYVKFNLPNKWDIYLHDTPGRYVFANKNRYLSHGCVRVKDPKTLAVLLLENQHIDIDSINGLIAKNKTKYYTTDPIPVYITYTTANADSALQKIIYLNDPYKKDSLLTANLIP